MDPTSDAPEWFSATKAATWLTIDRKTFVRLVRTGVFPRGRLRVGQTGRLWNRADMEFMAFRLAENERFAANGKNHVKPS